MWAAIFEKLWHFTEQLALLSPIPHQLSYVNRAEEGLWWTPDTWQNQLCPVMLRDLFSLASGSHTLPHCQETCSKNPWHLFSWCKEEVLQKLKLRTKKCSASETWSQEHLVFQHDKAIYRLGKVGAFLVWREVNYFALLDSYFRKLDCTTVTV